MKTWVLSDAHLRAPGDANYRHLVGFLQRVPRDVRSLVVLGDLFDFWMGDGPLLRDLHRPLLDALKGLARRGVRITYHEGNHDFALGPRLQTDLSARIVPDGTELRWGRRRFWLEHGDRINRADWRYRMLRRTLRSAPARRLRRWVPEPWVLRLARWMSHESRERWGQRGWDYAALFRDYARERLASGYDGVIVGHSHRPEITAIEVGGRTGVFVNTGDWMERFTYLEVANGARGVLTLSLRSAPLKGGGRRLGSFTFSS